MIAYLPQILGGFIILIVAITFCQVMIFIWRWVGLNFVFKPPLDPANMPEAIWMKTAPLIFYFAVMPFPIIAVLAVWDFKPISEPATHYLGLFVGSPVLYIGLLLVIAATHITFLKKANEDRGH